MLDTGHIWFCDNLSYHGTGQQCTAPVFFFVLGVVGQGAEYHNSLAAHGVCDSLAALIFNTVMSFKKPNVCVKLFKRDL